MRLIFSLVFLFNLNLVNSQDFRNVTWGDTTKKVLASENYITPTKVSEKLLEYQNIQIGLFDANIKYLFTNNRLDKIEIVLRSEYLPVSIMKDSNPDLNQILYWARNNVKINRFIHENGFDLGEWIHLFGDGWIENREQVSSKLKEISEEYAFDIGWNDAKGIQKLSEILKVNQITNPTYKSNSDRTLIFIRFNIIDNLPDNLKKRERNQILQLRKYSSGPHWRENLPIMEISLSARNGIIKEDTGF